MEPVSMPSLDRMLDESLLEETALLKAGGHWGLQTIRQDDSCQGFHGIMTAGEAVARYLCYGLGQ